MNYQAPAALNGSANPTDWAIEDALRASPLAPPPPLLYVAVMRQVRLSARPSFRVSWLDLALSLFASGMFGLVWLAWRWIPSPWLNYVRLEALWRWQKLWYLDGDWLILAGVGLAAGVVGLAVLWSCTKTWLQNA